MGNNELVGYGEKVFSKFDKKLKKALKGPEKDKTVHDLRTSIKRIKAYLKLIHFICPGFKYKKTFRPWKAFFKEMADFRDRQAHEKVAEKKLKTSIETIISKDAVPFPDLDSYKKAFDKKLYKKIRNKIESGLEEKPVSQCIRGYNEEITLKIRELLMGDKEYRRRNLHVLRKQLKEYYYNLDVLKKSKILFADAAEIEAWLKKMMDLLGDWHDVRSFADRTRKGSKRSSGDIGKESIKIKALSSLKAFENQYVTQINRICSDIERIESLFPAVVEV